MVPVGQIGRPNRARDMVFFCNDASEGQKWAYLGIETTLRKTKKVEMLFFSFWCKNIDEKKGSVFIWKITNFLDRPDLCVT